ncbi:hypothetical protein [Streptomyces sp. NPDC048496]|uniref:hypothetical protein n=1 Tax=Streptomyces sp. NPDC048496 TaxID=3365558 RepID=UPI003718C088
MVLPVQAEALAIGPGRVRVGLHGCAEEPLSDATDAAGAAGFEALVQGVLAEAVHALDGVTESEAGDQSTPVTSPAVKSLSTTPFDDASAAADLPAACGRTTDKVAEVRVVQTDRRRLDKHSKLLAREILVVNPSARIFVVDCHRVRTSPPLPAIDYRQDRVGSPASPPRRSPLLPV